MSSVTPDRVLSDRLGDRVQAAVARAERLLGEPGVGEVRGDGDDQARLRALVERLLAELAESDEDGAVAEAEAAVTEAEAAVERLRSRFENRFAALEAARRAVGELRQVTAPAAMLARAPAALCAASGLSRVVVSLTVEGRMVPEAAWFEGDAAGCERALGTLRAEPVRLEHPLIETELLRRRRATIVDDAHLNPRADRRLVELMGWGSYAVAPVVVATQVVGIVHADRGPGRRLDVLDRDVLWEFTSLLAQAYESAALRRTLRHERERMREFLTWIGARSSELTDAPIRLATVQRPPRPPLDVPVSDASKDDRVVFERLLTRRELDVLRLLADGRSNKAIADALVISDGTVKFHVNSILRKLHVANRAEAVARYLRLLGMRSP